MFTTLSAWSLRRVRTQQGERRRPHTPRRFWRPQLEFLEDRCVPSTLTVTQIGDDVAVNHTLRYAVAHAHRGDTILITDAVKSPIVLTHGDLVLDKDLTIEAVGHNPATVSGRGYRSGRVFSVYGGAHVTLSDLTITQGDDPFGGGIANFGGTLTVSGCTLSGNTAVYGGGIANFGGTMTVCGCTLSGNSALFLGGGIENSGMMTVRDSFLFRNSAENGGGIENSYAGMMTVSGCTLSGNTAFAGGGIENAYTGMMTVTKCTLSGNSASFGVASGINNEGGVTIIGCTVSTNNAGDIFNSGTLTVDHSTVSGNTATQGWDLYNFAGVATLIASTVPDIFVLGGSVSQVP
jgi:hypothetical protein